MIAPNTGKKYRFSNHLKGVARGTVIENRGPNWKVQLSERCYWDGCNRYTGEIIEVTSVLTLFEEVQ